MNFEMTTSAISKLTADRFYAGGSTVRAPFSGGTSAESPRWGVLTGLHSTGLYNRPR